MAEFNFDIFTHALEFDADGSGLVDAAVGMIRFMGEKDRWQVTMGGSWCNATPQGGIRRSQGWKLHVSATILSAETVLARALPVLVKGHSAVKFASTLHPKAGGTAGTR